MPTETGNYSRPDTPIKTKVTTAVRCKVCGYITDASKVGDLCPACGVKAAMFEPLTEKFSDDRRHFLDLHLHPILAHFPQAFSITVFFLAIGRLLLADAAGRVVESALFVLALALPVTLIGTFISGILDGRVRFKKLKAPYLRIKKWVGGAYLILSLLFAFMVAVHGCSRPLFASICIIVAVGMVICTSVLGSIGSKIACSRLPG
jgi:hypothetical protein